MPYDADDTYELFAAPESFAEPRVPVDENASPKGEERPELPDRLPVLPVRCLPRARALSARNPLPLPSRPSC